MENSNIDQIESYIRGKMSPEERTQFEEALAANPELRQRTDELRRFASDLRQIARTDIRKRVEAVRDHIKLTEAQMNEPVPTRPHSLTKSTVLLLIGALFGLVLGWWLFGKEKLPALPPPTVGTDDSIPVALAPFAELYRAQIPGPQPGETTSLTVLHDPDMDSSEQRARSYTFYENRGGLCIYARRNDDFWGKTLGLTQVGKQVFLNIGSEKYLLVQDGQKHILQLE